ncbi:MULTISPECIES: dihydropteroate synthase [Chryseobacterium]|uniref:Dihydropteroate synthase n=1 Tax=Chryseobacterium camelliae TaxID=1265445 RepID=A0ABU0TED1_9FLAO|nr:MULTISPECIES: dihydropteroate synthase [Chryseobacterium]MDT3406774.1 dihydropteroate synthase [Pseudacidovorax intermedius]MDQ1095430.1 dihydropteroate synthase [Chryseobacterium camelliae]MDQ1099370.1 dihydropteroate synthase [Chryseobacterium sp. SORGH_AS_1048]MDR6086716.1 dihydropteroate synthase [Chryseobacterium sp. SORGH_AS_0909]MDR6131088.1 dihydropteroate synthase [Chryseobacterium sp. SORGH_AS_1175]
MRDHFLNCNGRLIGLQVPKIMGILNLTPDSFSDGGKFNTEHSALLHAEKLILEGAEIIDIGPQSTRPGAEFLSSDEEIRRIGNVISAVKKEFPDVLVSLDTFYGATVRYGFNEGIDMVNDISAGQFDESMWTEVARTRLPYIAMHINPDYAAMHQKVQYEDITLAVNSFFMQKTRELMDLGIRDVILDPGFGFGKTVEDQMKLLEEIGYLGFGRFPLLIGISRKSFIYKPLGKSPSDINEETQKLHLKVLEQGAKILRVHDVAEAKKTVDEFLRSRAGR